MQISIDDPACEEARSLIAELDKLQEQLYPAESNFLLDVNNLGRPCVVFVLTREEWGTAVGCGALVMHDGYAELKRPPTRSGSIVRRKQLSTTWSLWRLPKRPAVSLIRKDFGLSEPRLLGSGEHAELQPAP